MELRAGEERPWPEQGLELEKGELILLMQKRSADQTILERQPLVNLIAGECLPSRPDLSDISFELRIRAVKDCVLKNISESRSSADTVLQERIKIKARLGDKSEADGLPLSTLIEELWAKSQKRQRQLQASQIRLDAHSDKELFLNLEQATHQSATPSDQNKDNIDPVQSCVEALLRQNGDKGIESKFKSPAKAAEEPRARLRQLLEVNGLIGRDVTLQGDLRQQDCGDLVAFTSDPQEAPILLRSTSSGYQVWIPSRMNRAVPLRQVPQLMEQINPRAISISQSFQTKDLTPLGLLRFAYGTPQNRVTFLIGGLLLGLALGFLLAIGREVGAARWIFGMGFTGLGMGASLGFLSGGFRVAVAVMLLATLLGLLTPTFNTVITNQALPDRDLGLLLQIAGILIAAGITKVALEWTQSRSLLVPQQKGAVRSQLAGIQRMLSLPINFFRDYTIGDLQLRFGSIDELRDEIQELLDGGLIKVVLSSIYILFLLKISVKLTLLAFVIALMLLVPTAIVGIQTRPLQRKKEEVEAQAQTRNLELISSVSKLRVAGAETRAANWWAEQFRRSVVLEEAIDAKEAIGELLSSIIPNLGNLLLYIVITKLISEAIKTPDLTAPNVGQLLGFFSAFGAFIGAMSSFAGLLVGALDIPIIYERARPILQARTEVDEALIEAPLLEGGLEFDRVSYRYESHLPLVLDQVSFKAKPGEFLAIVGPSGSGKSTLVRLMIAFAKPEDGTIQVDGQQLNSFRPNSIRRQIGTVLQNNALFSGSLFEAISGGQIISLEEAWEAANMAGLADDIQQMPMQMQTVISEEGGTLSGGQRQRMAIARAIVRRPRLLIFDEATSALDNATQAVVSQSLENLKITRIVIAHRLSTIRHADQIVVLEAGQVRQQGNFESLMSQKGLFANMMERQIS